MVRLKKTTIIYILIFAVFKIAFIILIGFKSFRSPDKQEAPAEPVKVSCESNCDL
jgi:hypothetical protein